MIIRFQHSRYLAIVFSTMLIFGLLPVVPALAADAAPMAALSEGSTGTPESGTEAVALTKGLEKPSYDGVSVLDTAGSESIWDKLSGNTLNMLNSIAQNPDGSIMEGFVTEAPWTGAKTKVSTPSDTTLNDPQGTVTLYMEAQYDNPGTHNLLTLRLAAAPVTGKRSLLKADESSVRVKVNGVDVTKLGYVMVSTETNIDRKDVPVFAWIVSDPALITAWANQSIVMKARVSLADPASVTAPYQKDMVVAGLGALGLLIGPGENPDVGPAFALAQAPWKIDIATQEQSNDMTTTPKPKANKLPPTGDPSTVHGLFIAGALSLSTAVMSFVSRRRRA